MLIIFLIVLSYCERRALPRGSLWKRFKVACTSVFFGVARSIKNSFYFLNIWCYFCRFFREVWGFEIIFTFSIYLEVETGSWPLPVWDPAAWEPNILDIWSPGFCLQVSDLARVWSGLGRRRPGSEESPCLLANRFLFLKTKFLNFKWFFEKNWNLNY